MCPEVAFASTSIPNCFWLTRLLLPLFVLDWDHRFREKKSSLLCRCRCVFGIIMETETPTEKQSWLAGSGREDEETAVEYSGKTNGAVHLR